MFLLRPPAFGGQSCLHDQMISRLPEVRLRWLKKGKSSEFNSRDDGTIIWKVLSYLVAQNKQIRSLAERAEITFRILPKRTFDLKSGLWIFFGKDFCVIFFNTRLQLAEENIRHLFEQVSGKELNR